MKLVVMIPAHNEERTITEVIKEIPGNAAEKVEVLVINDGSTDKTSEIAKEAGARVIDLKRNIGLGNAFREGLDTALEMNADIIVNIDADGQYNPKEIPKLIEPLLDGGADIVLGSRFKGSIEYMPLHKRIGNKLMTRVTSGVSGIALSDSQTGFRAFSREAALRLNTIFNYTYVQETIIQAANKGLKVIEVPCEFRRRDGKSRLISNIFLYAKQAISIILRTYLNHKPLKVFLYIGGFVFFLGAIFGSSVLYRYFQTGLVSPYYPTTILTAVLIIVGFQIIMLGLLADIINNNRRLMEEIMYRLKDKRIL